MSKPSQLELLDSRVAEELGVTLSPTKCVVKNLITKRYRVGGFYLAYEELGCVKLDHIPYVGEVNGLRIKPGTFVVPSKVMELLKKHHYRRWYYLADGVLYPVQQVKLDKLEALFPLDVIHEYPPSRVIPITDTMRLRKKALIAQRAKFVLDPIIKPTVKASVEA